VRDGLDPVPVAFTARQLRGSQLDKLAMGEVLELPVCLQEQFRDQPWELPNVDPNAVYEPDGPSYRLPAQEAIHQAPESARLAYAELLLQGLRTWPDTCLWTGLTAQSPSSSASLSVPTLVWSFLQDMEWLPVQRPDGELIWCAPESPWAWHTSDTHGEDVPRFAPLIMPRLRAVIGSDGRLPSRLRQLGLGMWDDSQHAGWLLWHHGVLLREQLVNAAQLSVFHGSYQATWARLAAISTRTLPAGLNPEAEDCLVVERAGRLCTVDVRTWRERPDQTIYVGVEDGSAAYQLVRGLGVAVITLRDGVQAAVDLLNHLHPGGARALADLAVEVVVDGVALQLDSGSVALVHDLAAWIPTLVGLTIEHRGIAFEQMSEHDFQAVIGRLRQIRVRWGRRIHLILDGRQVGLPPRLRGVFPVWHQERPTLVIESDEPTLTWSRLRALMGPLAELLGIGELADSLRLAIVELEQAGASLREGPASEQLAVAVDVTTEHVRRIRHRVGADIAPSIHRLYPILVHLTNGHTATVRIGRDGSITSHERLRQLVRELPLPAGLAADDLLDACFQTDSLDAVRRRLGLDFAAFNQTLVALAPDYRPITYPEEHRQAFWAYVSQRKAELLDRLRSSRVDRFDRLEVQDDWPALRQLSGLEPDDAWLLEHELPPEPLIARHLERWLTGHGTPTASAPLPPWQQTRQANLAFVRATAGRLDALMRAWTHTHGRRLPYDSAGLAQQLVSALDTAGALDFRLLDMPSLVNWCSAVGLWPAGMPTAWKPAALELTSRQLDSARQQAERGRRDRERQRKAVTVSGRLVDISTGDYTDLRQTLERSLEADPTILTADTKITRLAIQPPDAPHPPTSTPRRRAPIQTPPGSTGQRLSDEQREAIGFAGEWIAYQWLRHQYPTMTPECWASSYRTCVFPGDPGDDGLGYDFRVPTQDAPLCFEVKASTGNAQEFELTESEIREAQQQAATGDWRVIIVSHVLDDALRSILVLPNPFSAEGRRCYRTINRRLRLRYHLPGDLVHQ
jgi:hypothetical protein